MFWFIYKNDKQWLVYDWDVSKIDYCMDQLDALTWYKTKPDSVNYLKQNIQVYGRWRDIDLPMFKSKTKKDVDVTQDFLEYLAWQARYKMLTDKAYWIRQSILKYYSVYKRWGYVGFIKNSKPISTQEKYEWKDMAWLIMTKELLDWDIRIEPYKLNYQWTEKDIKIWHNYELDLFNKKVYIPGNYTNSLRQAMFKDNVNIKRPDIKMTWLLQAWQYDVILNLWRVTSFVAPRRWGKTFLLAFLALKEIIKNKYSIQSQFRPTTVLYLWLTSIKNYSVVQYIKKMVKQMGLWWKLMFDWNPTLKAYEFKTGKDLLWSIKFISINDDDPGIWDYADCIIVDEAHKVPRPIVEWLMPIVQNEGAKLICASTLYPDLPKNWFYDLVVQWETSVFNIEKEIENTYNRYEDLFKKIYHWKQTEDDMVEYNKVVEEWVNKVDYVWKRYTYDDIEYIPERRKEKTKKEEYEKNPRKFLISYYSRFPDEWKVFDYETALKIESEVKAAPYKYIILWYDPALTKDYSAIVVMWYNPYQKKLALLEEHSLKKTWRYEDQYEEIVKIREQSQKYIYEEWRKNASTFFVIDWTQKATPEIFEMKWFRIDCKVAYHAWRNINTKTDIRWEHAVPKKYLIELFSEMLDNRKVWINKELTKTINEMWSFKMKLMASWYVKYEAESWHNDDEGNKINDDFVNATLLANYFACNVLGLKYYMFKENLWIPDRETEKLTRKELAKYHKEIRLKKEKEDANTLKEENDREYYNTHIY